MKILFTDTESSPNLFIPFTDQNQKILIWFEDGGDWYVYYADDYTSNTYINRIINKTFKSNLELFNLNNLEVIEDDQQFNSYFKWIQDNYNYNLIHRST